VHAHPIVEHRGTFQIVVHFADEVGLHVGA
jgi:hypothetical protein